PDPFFPFDERLRHPYVGAQLILDTRDNPVLAHRGVLASADLSGSGHAVGSDFDYLRWFGQLNLYHEVATLAGAPLTWDQSVRVGLAHAFAGQELIPDVRFFAGGEYSVRGYPNNSLGPTESLGSTVTPSGGAALLVINEELRVPLVTGLFGLVFFDAGQVWTSTGDFGRGLVKSLGLGLRAATPIGVLRFDAAHPLDRPPGDKAVRFTLGFGNVF
ncbi:MAG: BamA/TamA family outer membrane protein, partial [Thermoanaerobaculales bacterium]